MNQPMIGTLAFLFLISFAGCATTTDMATVEQDVGAQQPLAYKQGYGDGCDSGRSAADVSLKFSKDVRRVAQDALYKAGMMALPYVRDGKSHTARLNPL